MWDVLLSGSAAWFSVPALAGTALFVLKLILMTMGGDHGHGLEGHDTASLDHGVETHDGIDLKLLSVQGVLAFLMAFGWSGLIVLSSTRAQLIVAIAVGLVAGLLAMYVMARLMASLIRLQASGTIDPQAAVGSEGTVYVSIPEGGKGMGQVTLVIDQKQRLYYAVSAGPALGRNTRVRVLAVQDKNTLSVEPT